MEVIIMDKCGIYKITNLINGKIYIGQSRCIYRRWVSHRRAAKDNSNQTLLYKAMRKYGLENFLFEIEEECSPDQLNDKEAYYMYHYNCFSPNGYNIRIPVEDNIYVHVPDYVHEIIFELMHSHMTMVEIGQKFSLSDGQIQRINKGESWRLQEYTYPIRKSYNNWDQSQVLTLLQKGYKVKEIADSLNTTKGAIQGYMQANNIHTADFRKRLSSNKQTYLIKDGEEKIFNSIKEAGEYLSKKESIEFNTALCGIKRALKRKEPKNEYKGYICTIKDSFIEEL